MQILRGKLRPGQLDYEFVWLSVSAISLGLAIAWFGIGLPWPHCLFHEVTGWPCLTCGATRSTIAFLHGHFLDALKWNPLVFMTLCGAVSFNGYALAVLLARAPRVRLAPLTPGEGKIVRIFVMAALALNWVYLLRHWQRY